MHLKKIAKNLIIEQHLYEYKKAPLERFTFLQISSELIFVHHWMVELGSVIKVKPGVTRGPLCVGPVSLLWFGNGERSKMPMQVTQTPWSGATQLVTRFHVSPPHTPLHHWVSNCTVKRPFYTLLVNIHICQISENLLWFQGIWRWRDIFIDPKV